MWWASPSSLVSAVAHDLRQPVALEPVVDLAAAVQLVLAPVVEGVEGDRVAGRLDVGPHLGEDPADDVVGGPHTGLLLGLQHRSERPGGAGFRPASERGVLAAMAEAALQVVHHADRPLLGHGLAAGLGLKQRGPGRHHVDLPPVAPALGPGSSAGGRS